MEDYPEFCECGAVLITQKEKFHHRCPFIGPTPPPEKFPPHPSDMNKCPICGKLLKSYEIADHILFCEGGIAA